MKSARRVVIGLAVLLAVLGVGLLLGSPDSDNATHSRSFGRSGTSVLAELIRQSGRKVISERSMYVDPPAGSLAILPFLESDFGPDIESVLSGSNRVTTFAQAGGTVLALSIFPELTEVATARQADWADGEKMEITALEGEPDDRSVFEASYPLVTVEEASQASALRDGKGTIIRLADGYAAANSNIGELDNAAFILKLVELGSEPGGTIVFLDAYGGGGQVETPLTVFGRAGRAIGWQLILLGVVAFLAGFVRFGPVMPAKTRAAGARSLFDAFGELSRRQKRHSLALGLVTEELEARLRRAAGVTPQASQPDLIKKLPPEAAAALMSAWRFDPPQNGARAAELARALLQATESLEAMSRNRSRAG
jgi:hypothetical protein